MKLAYLFCVLLVPVFCAKDDAVASYVQGQNNTQVGTELTTEKPVNTDTAQSDTTPVPNSDQLQYPQDYPTLSNPGQPGQFYPGQGYPGQYNGGQFYPGQYYPGSYGQPYFPNIFPWSFSPQNLYASMAQQNYELSRRIAESINQQMQQTQAMTNAMQENIRNNLYQQALYNYYANYVPYNPNMFIVPQTGEGDTNPDIDSNKETISNATISKTAEENSSSSSSSYTTSSDYTPATITALEEMSTSEKEEIAEATTQFVDIVDVRTKDTKDSPSKSSDTITTTTAKSIEAKTSPTLTTKNQPTTVTHTTTKPVTTTKAKTPVPKTTTTTSRSKTEKPKPQSTTSKPKSTTISSIIVFRDSDEEADGGSRAIIPKVDPSAPCVPPLVKDKNGKCINSRDNFNGGCPTGQMRAGDDTCQDEV